jgi:ABC-2 type transport system ATP-binding protein
MAATIRFESVHKEYGRFTAIHRLDLEVQAGEIYGLIGPNGAGKTTVIRMACGLLAPTSGHVFVMGLDVQRQAEAAQQYIGYLSDVYALYEDLTAWEYLDYFAHAYRMPERDIGPRIKEVLGLVGLEVKEHELTKGLSRGMRQRLGLARAILHRPKLLLLDEPASGLDPKARVELRDVLVSLRAQGTTVLISSHILNELDGFCTMIGIMERGMLIRSESLSSLTKRDGNLRKVRLRWIGEGREPIERVFSACSGFLRAEWSDNEVLAMLEASDESLADLHAELVTQGARLIEFAEQKQTVQEAYMHLSQHEVM